MKYIILALLGFAFSMRPSRIDPKLQPYVDLFESKTNQYGNRIKIRYDVEFAELEGVRAAVCHYSYLFGGALVQVDPYNFNSLSENVRIAMLFHEFGHCSLDRRHSGKRYRGLPLSWMHYQLFHFDPLLFEGYMIELITGKDDILKKKMEKM